MTVRKHTDPKLHIVAESLCRDLTAAYFIGLYGPPGQADAHMQYANNKLSELADAMGLRLVPAEKEGV